MFGAKYYLCLILLICQTAVLACSCGHPLLEDEISRTNAIFIGVVESTEIVERHEEFKKYPHKFHKTTFKILESIKGVNHNITILSSVQGCSYEFKVDSSYVVFASSRLGTDTLFTSSCTRTERLSIAKDLSRQLLKLKNRAYEIDHISGDELYGKIWENEIFDRVKFENDWSEFQITKEFTIENLEPCKPGEFIPKTKGDSGVFRVFFPKAYYEYRISFVVDEFGNIHNPEYAGTNFGAESDDCIKKAIQYVSDLPKRNIGSIRGFPVKYHDFVFINFQEVNSGAEP